MTHLSIWQHLLAAGITGKTWDIVRQVTMYLLRFKK